MLPWEATATSPRRSGAGLPTRGPTGRASGRSLRLCAGRRRRSAGSCGVTRWRAGPIDRRSPRVVSAQAAAAGGARARSGACRLRDRSAGRRLDARADRRSAEARCGARPALRLDRDDPPRGSWAWIFRPGQKPAQLWRYLPRRKAKRGRAASRTPTVASDAGCREQPISTPWPNPTSRRSP